MSGSGHGDRTLMRAGEEAKDALRLDMVEDATKEHESRLDALEKDLATKMGYVYGVIGAVTTIAGVFVWALSL